MNSIRIRGAEEGNLKKIDLDIPRGQLTVFTGLSGSGKSTLVDLIYQECQRQYLETIGMEGIRKPRVESVRSLSPAVLIAQTDSNRNPRSTVGTRTNLYTDLRMIYEKLGERICPHCGETVSSADCREVTIKENGEFRVYMDCCRCGRRMDKLTRTHFSYNTKEGACPRCEGLGSVLSLLPERCVDESLSPEDGAVDYWTQGYKAYQIDLLYKALRYYGVSVEPGTPVGKYPPAAKTILYHGTDSDEVGMLFPQTPPPKTTAAGRFEGVLTTLWRRMSEKGGDAKGLKAYFDAVRCPDCGGERLNALSRGVTVGGVRLPQLSVLSLEELSLWIGKLRGSLREAQRVPAEIYLSDLDTKLDRLNRMGLGYLSIDRQTMTLSGGEGQRVRLSAALDSDITGIIYFLDEPTAGLHPRDTEGVIAMLRRLRDLGNTMLVIEHDTDMMQAADYLIDMGPGAGRLGGEVVGTGTLDQLRTQPSSVTGQYLNALNNEADRSPGAPIARRRPGSGAYIGIEAATLHNLDEVVVRFPSGCLIVVTGVSGSGKSSLIFGVLAEGGNSRAAKRITGLDDFEKIVTIRQAQISRMKRSNVATYSGVYADIRKLFGAQSAAKARGLSARSFSFNTPGGRCENCEGLGTVTSNMLFFLDIEVTCPVCGGRRFQDEVLAVTYNGQSIHDVLGSSVAEAAETFAGHAGIGRVLGLLGEVGLGYLELGRMLTTLSGGEGQRLKLAAELLGSSGKKMLYLMDEPTAGLHPLDTEHFLILLNRMVDAGHTVIVVEHNLQVIEAADWIVDLGPEGGVRGGEIVFEGTPEQMRAQGRTATAEHLRGGR
ncbi:excinuclease ABC subunit UvrA [Saccharibacillus sp. CPCC 101409]|uniref:excinuclease ABC subunit UvrA n=1 Tax=Saccharibacillus sp. CPCC 101409 TaxID=3058041 RepID=UPI0026721FBF|nr:excinuclease ABC subunit UvrA [Saccharibacillus sp. CPCC 101409]MDO3412369.1 excinuclease ABC subunit UvrA [Saccharibacillus sp. CPCC 101409]